MWNRIYGSIKRNLAAGLVVIIPIVLTAWVVYAVYVAVDAPLRAIFEDPGDETGAIPAIARFLKVAAGGRDLSFMAKPGVGIVLVFTLLFMIGFLARTLVGKFFVGMGDTVLGHIPFVKTLYVSTKQLLSALLGGSESPFREVVLVEYPKKNSYVLGFLASKGKGELAVINAEPVLNIFIPTTPNPTSGYLVLVPESRVKKLNMSVENAVKFIISSGIVADPTAKEPTVFETPTTKFSLPDNAPRVHPDIKELTEAIEMDAKRLAAKKDVEDKKQQDREDDDDE
ncbi:MAG: DUF502 domain-containing protein [Planctomycetes bacterium]|nr:DUF502 domain-containing protein [Planctomycetota bacterium]